MAQYSIYTDPLTGLKIRDGVRDGKYIIDKELIVGGFFAGEGFGWENISTNE
jgi:hypothetical protein